MMDGVSTMDTGSNASLLQMNVESIAEVKVLVSNYQAEYGRSSGLQITAVTKSGTNRFRGSVYDVERNSDWNSNTKANKLNGDPKTVSEGARLGLLDRRSDRQAGRQQQAVLLLQPGVRAAHGRQRRAALPLPDRARARRATSRRRPTTTATRSRTSGIRGSTGDVLRERTRAACFADGGVLGRIPKDRLYQTGLNILNMFPMPNITNVPAGQTYNYEITRPTEKLLAWQPAIRVDYKSTSVAARDVQVLGLGAAEADDQRVDSRAATTRQMQNPGRQHVDGDGQLQPDADDVPRGDVRAEPERAGRLRPGADRHRSDLLPERVSR